MTNKKTQNQTTQEIKENAAKALLGEGRFFHIPFIFGTKLKLAIKPLRPMTIVRVSQQVNRLKRVSDKLGTTLQGMLEAGTNYRIFARIVAISVINNRIPGRILTGALTRLILWKAEKPSDIHAWMNLAFMQTDPEVFFYIMVSARGMDYLETKTAKPGEATPSGGQ